MSKYGAEGSNDRGVEYGTPRWFLDPIEDAVGGFDLDPCSGAEDAPHAAETYTIEDDGLSQQWFGTVWCNPPFSDKKDWLRKAVQEHNDGHTDLTLVLLPVDTSTGWFHDLVVGANAVWFKEGRLSFDGSDNWTPNFGIMLAVYGDAPDELLELLSHRGEVFDRRERYQRSQQEELPTSTTPPYSGDHP